MPIHVPINAEIADLSTAIVIPSNVRKTTSAIIMIIMTSASTTDVSLAKKINTAVMEKFANKVNAMITDV